MPLSIMSKKFTLYNCRRFDDNSLSAMLKQDCIRAQHNLYHPKIREGVIP